jgi:peptidoglycan hydrolase CwlO-like protein
MGIIDLFGSSKVKELEKENQELKEKLSECSDKLIEKQEHINKTNAFWKKKLRETGQNSKKS